MSGKSTIKSKEKQPTDSITLKQLLKLTDRYAYVRVIGKDGKELYPMKLSKVALKHISKELLDKPVVMIQPSIGRDPKSDLSAFTITYVV